MTNEHADFIVTILDKIDASLDRIATSLEQQTDIMNERNKLLKVNNAIAEDDLKVLKELKVCKELI